MLDIFHVLVVEDDPDVAEYLRLVLVKKAGMRVDVAADIQAATDILRHCEVDVLLTDIELHGSSGLELATRARELVPLMSIAVMTAHTSAEHALTAQRCRVDGFLVKPIRGATLVSTITLLAQLGRERHSAADSGRPSAEVFG
jgi:DNA-binding response OmpR family regulator